MFTELYREERREEGDRGGQDDKEGNQKERQIQPEISFLSVLHHPEHTSDSVLGREEKGEGGDRGDLVEKKESPKERAVKPVISLSSKNGY